MLIMRITRTFLDELAVTTKHYNKLVYIITRFKPQFKPLELSN